MGVPKFFRYISERYPCLSELIKEHQISDFDNLYLDMNGIIHMCSHPDDSNPHFRITEEKIFSEIFHYISYLFQLIRPKKVFFMAVDGVAPRAKMNQQRGRRFRTAKEAQQMEDKAKAKGEVLPAGKRFDSNCITPGTVFMARLHQQLRYFVKQKISTDSAWAKCRVVLSGHETPGEGEHKVMEYIRFLKAQPDHDPNTRHCLYGLDADLIMLGLCTHEPNFSLLREEVKFGKNSQRPSTPDENTFFLLHLSLLRDYLEQEFLSLKEELPFEFDMEKIIDDWVLMGFLVGNDFIPPLPHLHIHTDALPLLHSKYKSVITKLDGYINEGGILNLERFEVFMKSLSDVDKQNFQDIYTDLKYFESKTGRKLNEKERKSYRNVPDDNETFGFDIFNMPSSDDVDEKSLSVFKQDLSVLIDRTNEMTMDPDEVFDEQGEDFDDDSDSMFNSEFCDFKKEYYINKMEYENVTPEVLQSQAECYVRAIQWILNYYYQGCSSWAWYYPHHYAPYISDVVNFKDMDLHFDMGKPFKPFEQLLAVLPSASKELLPEVFHQLMTDDNSPLLCYYPMDFKTDLNGKRNEWEAVVLIPFIDEENLLSAMQPLYEQLTEEETKRNTHGPMLIYDFTPQDLGECHAPEYFPVVKSCHARETPVLLEDIAVAPENVIRGPLPNPNRGVFYPGIATFKHIEFKSHFTKAKVKVFDFPSRGDNCILSIIHDNKNEQSIKELAAKLLGKVVWVGWPHLGQAKVVEISNEKLIYKYSTVPKEFSAIEDDQVDSIQVVNNDSSKISQFELQKRTILEHHINRMGIEVGKITTIVHVRALKGLQYTFGPNGQMLSKVEWCQVTSPYPIQAVISDISVAPVYSTRNMSAQDVLPVGDKVFIKTGPYYGCMAEIKDSSNLIKLGRVTISVSMEAEPNVIPPPSSAPPTYYMAGHAAAVKCGISVFMLSRITGCIFVSASDKPEDGGKRTNIGLNIKYSKKNEELTGYTKRIDNRWLYSQKCVNLVNDYSNNFHDMFQRLALKIEQDNFTEKDLFPNNIGENKLQEIVEWLKEQPHTKCSVRSCDSQGLEPEELAQLRNTVMVQKQQLKDQIKKLTLQVKPHVLFKPDLHSGTIPPDPTVADFQLYDRVVNVNPRSTVPLGRKGTIINISQSRPRTDTINLSDKLNSEPLYQILFDEPFLGGVNTDGIDDNRIFKMQGYNLLNITYGLHLHNKTNNKVQLTVKPGDPSDSINALRSNDGHNSAFANYTSPTKHIQNWRTEAKPPQSFAPKPTVTSVPAPNPLSYNSNVKPIHTKIQTTVDDSDTQLLKSLLKISNQHQPPPNFTLANFPSAMPPRQFVHHNVPPPSHPSPHHSMTFPPPPLTFNAPPPLLQQPLMTANQMNIRGSFMPQNQQHYNSIHLSPHHNYPTDNPGAGMNYMQPGNMNSQPTGIQSQHFFNSSMKETPKNLQLPFPQKFVEQDSSQSKVANNQNDGTQPKTSASIPSEFIPLQALQPTRSRNSIQPGSNKHYKKSEPQPSNCGNAEKWTVVSAETQPDNKLAYATAAIEDGNEKNKKRKPKKSRVAANFGMLPQ